MSKTTNILPITDGQSFIIVSMGLIAGNHNHAYNLKTHLQAAFNSIKHLEFDIQGVIFNADKAFDTKSTHKTCFNHAVVPNIDKNKRNRKTIKCSHKRHFNPDVYKHYFTSKRSFAWINKFRALLVRFYRRDI